MLNSPNTDNAVVELMKKGAKVCYHIRAGGPEFPDWVERCGLLHNGQELAISEQMADRLRLRSDVHRGYAGWRGDYARKWQEVWKHEDAPVPVWIREQWATPIERLSAR